MYEDPKLRDEPRSYANGATPRDYSYLDHIYTTNLIETYELFGDWKKFVDLHSLNNNEDEKLMVMEAYADPVHTMQYYDYNV
ncbi:PREDICTED: maltase 1-like, partial [Wasmannia auropunctata]|uniref:maltase 1-like n=1 Tax=Wasmannia auropunctata TaxID=64793 RepID=UPI0005F02979